MKLTRQNLINVLIAAVAALAFGAFVLLAEGGDDKGNNAVDALGATTTTAGFATTSTGVTTPTTVGFSSTTIPTATTAKPTTATTKKPSGGTPTPTTTRTTVAPGPSGPATEHTDNSASFNHGSDGSFNVSKTDPPGGADPFRFVVSTAQGSGGVSGDTASVKFTFTLTNNTAKTIAFPGGLKIIVTMKTPGGSDVVFTTTASSVNDIAKGETITISQERGVSGFGSFDVTATCDVDYG